MNSACRYIIRRSNPLEDYKRGLGGRSGEEAAAYAAGEPDVALWEGERLLAVIRPRAGGDPKVTRFD